MQFKASHISCLGRHDVGVLPDMDLMLVPHGCEPERDQRLKLGTSEKVLRKERSEQAR